MPGRIAVPHMMAVARARFPLSLTRVAGLAGSPARALCASVARTARHHPDHSPFGATRRALAWSTRGAARLDLSTTAH